MKKEYDFTNAERGKFYQSDAKLKQCRLKTSRAFLA